MIKRFLIVLVCILCVSYLNATNLKITVMDKNNPVQDALVVILEEKWQERTGENGIVTFSNLTNGKYTIVIVLPGYEKFTKEIIINDKDLEIRANLKRISLSIGEITVEEKREKGKVPSAKKITGEEIKNSPQLFVNDAIKIVQSMPGIGTSGNMFDARMFIQGGDYYENIALIDGVVLLNPYKWGGTVSMFNPNWIDYIELYTAGYPAFFAQGLSGILNIKIKEGNKEKLSGFFDISSATSEVGLDGPIGKKVTFYFNIRRTYYDFLAPLFMKISEGYKFPYITDGILKLTFTPTIDDKFSFFIYASEEGMKLKLDEVNDSMYNSEFTYYIPSVIFGTRYDRRINEKDSFDITFGFTYNQPTSKFTAGPIGLSEFDAKIINFQPLINLYINSLENHKIQMGVTSIFLNLLYNRECTKFYSLDSSGNWTNNYSYENEISNKFMQYYMGYIMDNWEFVKSFILEIGLKYEYFQKTGETILNPSAGLKWEVSDNYSIYIRGGRYNRFPFSFYYLDEKYGNTNLQSEKVYHALLGTEFDKSPFLVRLELFYKYYNDLIFNDTVKHFNNDGLRESYGGALYLQKKKNNSDFWNGWISYTYVHGLEKVTNLGPIDPAFPSAIPLNEWYVPYFLREHTLSINLELINKLKFDNKWIDWLYNWSFVFDFKLMSGAPYTPITNFISQEIPSVGTTYYYQEGKYNSEYTPLYHKLDFKINIPGSIFDFLKLFGLKFESTSYLSFINIYNNENVYNYRYIVKNNKLEKVAEKDFGFMILGGFKIEF